MGPPVVVKTPVVVDGVGECQHGSVAGVAVGEQSTEEGQERSQGAEDGEKDGAAFEAGEKNVGGGQAESRKSGEDVVRGTNVGKKETQQGTGEEREEEEFVHFFWWLDRGWCFLLVRKGRGLRGCALARVGVGMAVADEMSACLEN